MSGRVLLVHQSPEARHVDQLEGKLLARKHAQGGLSSGPDQFPRLGFAHRTLRDRHQGKVHQELQLAAALGFFSITIAHTFIIMGSWRLLMSKDVAKRAFTTISG